MDDALTSATIGLVASYVLAGGTLTGKYLRGETGRATDDTNPAIVAGKDLAARLVALAGEWHVSATHLAFAFALSHPRLASVLFGATTPEQLHENVAALAVHDALDDGQRATLHDLAS